MSSESPFTQRGMTATGQVLALDVRGHAGATIQITGTWVGTIAFKGSADGVTFVPLVATKVDATATGTTTTGNGGFAVSTAGLQLVSAEFSVYTSGEAVVSIRSSINGPGGSSSGGGGGGAVTIADGADVALGTTTDAAWTTGAGTVIGLLKGLYARLTTVISTLGSPFQAGGSLGASTALIGQVSASAETSTVYNGTTALTPKYAVIAASTSGDNTLVAAVTGKKIRVLAYNFMANGAVNGKFQSGASGTDLTGLKYCATNTGICAPFNPAGWFQTSASALLNLNLSGAVAVGGELVYVEV